jgi:predicted AAA+ superfamily ATPase
MVRNMRLVERFFKAPNDSFFIFGPRGTGKSTWIKQTIQDVYLFRDSWNIFRSPMAAQSI